MVNMENMRKWVAALRSGEFKQGRNYLAAERDDGWRFCCLGVACEVAIRDGLELEVREHPPVMLLALRQKAYGSAAQGAALPEEVRRWLGVAGGNPRIGRDITGHIRAAVANDALNWDFEQIADAIEEYYGLREE